METQGETLRIDGRQLISTELVAQVGEACDRAEALGGQGRLVVLASGAPAQARTEGLTVALVSRWERALRRLERLPATIVGVADGEIGGPALDALLATDYRIATPATRLVVPVSSGATWPGMALYRLAHQGSNTAAIRRALLFGDPIGARDALALQLIDEVSDDVAGALAAVAELTGALSGRELAIRRQLMIDAATTSFEEALGVHLAACDRTLRLVSAEAVS
ncbi:enoyl-CoA-hydratase DpgB [Streptomyces sp. NPDC013172]|uniref:enoyl-CoA-hydratase DpgB n=1 Tax=unclassified Streptomyces TaxID=2593676 RepID=UPI000FB13D04|nr:enoyl-CoA-hydratase DpgB [Streptomyces sp. Ag109_O5-1]RPE41527.1 (3,5-dihydroxycyclohex-3-enyl)acetyl-CoA dehydratase subunit B [Streptomyces sp. Ag109_O5-1]